ncbi:MAG TPA: FtsX-like permease family protein [Ignavibacteriales bacterium]|nr:FtsX-like permease family protein [Ignavibacteriales bacterium]
MLKQNLKIAFRNIKKGKLFSFINIAGLAFALSAAFIILLFVSHELSYDKFQKNYDRTYIAYHKGFMGGYHVPTPFVFADAIRDAIPGAERIAQVSETWQEDYFVKDNNFIKTENVYYAEQGIFDILTFDFAYGSPKNFSFDVTSVLISESAREKYFPDNENAVGQVIQLQTGTTKHLLKIAGIFKDIPSASHFRPDYIMSMELVRRENADALTEWGFNNPVTYVLMKKNADMNEALKTINAIVKKANPQNYEEYSLLPLAGLHINDLGLSIGKSGSAGKLYIFSAIGVLILLMACFNFINMSTAGAAARAKEIGIRKTIGADKWSLIKQLLSESFLTAFIAFPLAVLLTEILTPMAAKLFDRDFDASIITNWKYLGLTFLIVLFTGIFSGSFYAVSASKYNPIQALNNKLNFNSAKSPFRRALITLQFIVFTGMIICSIIMFDQMEYISAADLGYKKENVLNLNIPYGIDAKSETFKEILKQVPGVRNVSINSTTPPAMGNFLATTYKLPAEEKELVVNVIFCDENYKDALGLNMVKGEFFSGPFRENNEMIVLNEAAAKLFRINSPGYAQSPRGENWNVTGIIKDFNITDLYGKIGPVIIKFSRDFISNYTVRINGKETRGVMEKLQQKWSEFYPDLPFTYKFIDEEYDARYRDDMRLSQMIGFFTGAALFIAVIGLFGISVYSASQRMKEIGIRKVFGASIRQIMVMLNKEVFVISIIGSVIAFPLAYYLMSKWLETFAYRIKIGYEDFILAFVLSFTIGIAAVSFQAFKAAIANPIDSIRSE